MNERSVKLKRAASKAVAGIIAAAFICCTFTRVYAAEAVEGEVAAPVVADPVDVFLSQSAFVGNSVGEGLTMFNNARGRVPLGNATMLTRVSYSFWSDENSASAYLPRYQGVPMRAKDAIKACGACYAFICMGTNDLVGKSGVESAVSKYQQYIAEIKLVNPGITIFIESCTPTRPGSNVSNEKVTAFNAYMQGYCDMMPDMYYVDIASPLRDGTGYLAPALSSDGSVHLTNRAYEIWSLTVRNYISAYLAQKAAELWEKNASDQIIARETYNNGIKQMEEKKQQYRDARLQASREEKTKQSRQCAALDLQPNLTQRQDQLLLLLKQPSDPLYNLLSSDQM